MDKFGIIDREKTAFVLIDVQEGFLPVIHDLDRVIENCNILIQVAKILDIPLVVTEQYPKGLGRTVEAIKLDLTEPIIEKVHFSCFGCDGFTRRIESLKVDTLVLFGIEAHVCVLNTALSALERDYAVHVVTDAVSSRTEENRHIALERMRQSGVFICSTEMIIFQLLKKAGTDEFKKILPLVK